ncbi:MAG: DEAD/DEAH box helicase [Candidatus Aminicenantes bacterium]|nr:MAG: DEAD/DEAH box helicase [Candidatus Aminicenantes bacterium]
MKFDELKLEPRLLRGIANRGYKELTAVQEQTLAKTLQGMDVAVQSQTGTGKTAAFLITLFERMSYNRTSKRKKALIIVPTRELAVQIEKEARLLNRHLGYAIGSFYGGVGYERQLNLLKKGLDIVIGTPGRLLDLSKRGHLKLKDIRTLVIDEADRLFDMGFLPDIKRILYRMPPRNARQNMLFSATLNRISRRIASEHMNRPELIEVTPERLTVDTILQELYHVKSHIKMNLMLGILKAQAPQNALIFTNMRHVAFRLAKKLQQNGLHSRHLTGDLPQSRRLKIMDDFKAGKFALLVATDVAARGLHIDDLEMVINYDLPQDCENYVHRIGRTARAGNSGKAISLASEGTADHLEAIESFIGMKIPVQTANDDLFATDMSLELSSRKRFRNDRQKNSRINSRFKNNYN